MLLELQNRLKHPSKQESRLGAPNGSPRPHLHRDEATSNRRQSPRDRPGQLIGPKLPKADAPEGHCCTEPELSKTPSISPQEHCPFVALALWSTGTLEQSLSRPLALLEHPLGHWPLAALAPWSICPLEHLATVAMALWSIDLQKHLRSAAVVPWSIGPLDHWPSRALTRPLEDWPSGLRIPKR